MPSPELAYDPGERQRSLIGEVVGPLMLPLAFVRKGPMRDFNAFDPSGEPLPVLGSSEVQPVVIDVFTRALRRAGVDFTPAVREALLQIIGPAGLGRTRDVEALCTSGMWEEERLWDPRLLPQEVAYLLRVLTSNFLLVVLLPAEAAGLRGVIKFSFHNPLLMQQQAASPLMTTTERLLCAFGFTPFKLELDMMMPDAAASYHLEFHTPPQLKCLRLELPLVGARLAALASSGLATCVFLLALALPGALNALLDAADGASAILLAGPAVLIGYLASGREHHIASSLSVPLRISMILSALSLLIMAASIVGGLVEPFIWTVWATGFLVNGMIFIPILAAALRRPI